MARTFQQVVDRARLAINDPSKTRHSDATLLKGANDGILVLRSKRPDLFFGQYDLFIAGEYLLADSLPIGDEYFVPMWQFTAAWAEHRDDEEAMQSLAREFYGLFADGAGL